MLDIHTSAKILIANIIIQYNMNIKINPDGIFPALTKGEIREAALKEFRAMGFYCWRNNNTSPTRRRTFIGEYGVSDIIGYAVGHTNNYLLRGSFMCGEVKTQSDKLSQSQKDFLLSVNKAGGYAYVIEDDKRGGIKYYLYLNEKQ